MSVSYTVLDCLSNTVSKAKYSFVGDEAFTLKENLQRAYPGRNSSEKLCIYNYRLSHARRVVKNAFGILSACWRFFRSQIQAQPEKAVNSVLAAIALHNWLKKHEDSQQYGKSSTTDSQGRMGMEKSFAQLAMSIMRTLMESCIKKRGDQRLLIIVRYKT
eukprot:gene5694-10941_t